MTENVVTDIQKKERKLRLEWLYYKRLMDNGVVRNKEPLVTDSSKERSAPRWKGQLRAKLGKYLNEFAQVYNDIENTKNCTDEGSFLIRDKVLELEREVFDLQAKLMQRGLPLL